MSSAPSGQPLSPTEFVADVAPAGETALRIVFDAPPSPELTAHMIAVAEALQEDMPDGSVSAVPGYQVLALHFDPELVTRGHLQSAVTTHLERKTPPLPPRQPLILPVWYDPSVAPDLEWLAQHAEVSIETVIRWHSETTYYAFANGFAPGFCYLGEVDHRLAAPRLATPRREVPAGSVAIADRQTAVYPSASPGGWRIIGRCPTTLFAIEEQPPNRINVGDRVIFEAIDRERFLALGGVL
jgi:KipI family sensor histidine kinase inhibitor